MLLKANWKDGEFLGVDIKRGSFATSLSTMSSDTGLTVREIRTAIKHLKTTGEVTSIQHTKFTVFTVNNYDKYQSSDTDSDKQATQERQASDTGATGKRHRSDRQATTIEEVKNIRKEEGKKGRREEDIPQPPYYPNDEKLDRAFCDWVEMRSKTKFPMNTKRMFTIAFNDLEKLCTVNGVMDNDLAIAIIEQSILNGYRAFFPLRNGKQKLTYQQPTDTNSDDEYWAELERRAIENDRRNIESGAMNSDGTWNRANN